MPAIRAWRSRTTTSCSGTCPRTRRSCSRWRSRRRLLRAGGACSLLAAPRRCGGPRPPAMVEIRMRSDPDGAQVGFDPIGLKVAPGRPCAGWSRPTCTPRPPTIPQRRPPAAHPRGAEPWNSDYLVEPGESFEVTLTVEGVYDYFCAPHEIGRHGRPDHRRPAGRARGAAVRLFPGRSGEAALARRAEGGTAAFPPIAGS